MPSQLVAAAGLVSPLAYLCLFTHRPCLEPNHPPLLSLLHAAAAAKRAALSLPVVVIQPDSTYLFGAKLYRTESGSMR